MKRKTLEIIIFLYIALLVYAGLTKLMDHAKFVVQLGQSPMLTGFAGVLSWGLPAAEFAVAVMLIVPRARLAGLYTAFCLMVMFTTYIVLASRFSDYVPCSCGGILEGMSWTEHLVFNSVFVVLGVVGILIYPVGSRGMRSVAG